VKGDVEELRLEQPRQKVPAAEPTRDPRGAPASEEHVSSRLKELLGKLASGLSAADDQNLSGRKCLSVAVVFRVDGVQAARERRGGRRTVSFLVRARRDHDGLRAQIAFGCSDHESVVDRLKCGHGDPLANRGLERACI